VVVVTAVVWAIPMVSLCMFVVNNVINAGIVVRVAGGVVVVGLTICT